MWALCLLAVAAPAYAQGLSPDSLSPAPDLLAPDTTWAASTERWAFREASALHQAEPSRIVRDTVALALLPESMGDSTLVLWHVGLASAGIVATGAGVMEWLHTGWWDEHETHFRIRGDTRYARNADKLGHAWGGMFLARTSATSLEVAGVRSRNATLIGASAAWSWLLLHEIYDGYGPHWGFDPGDLLGNTVGVAWEVVQREVPPANAFSYKLSYWPTGDDSRTILEDYRGQTYWLAVTPHTLLPETVRTYVPPWLGATIGRTVRGSHPEYGYPTEVGWTVGLDLNVCKLGLRGQLAETACGVFQSVHLPMPGVRLAPEARFLPLAY